jgi:hypothetical protein
MNSSSPRLRSVAGVEPDGDPERDEDAETPEDAELREATPTPRLPEHACVVRSSY